MSNVALLYVGAVLILNGLMLLGIVDGRSAAPLNFFVGAVQVVTPTYLIFTAGGDQDAILAASGLYLFGFTHLYVGLNLLGNLDGTGLGWFSAFVAGCALVYAGLSFSRFDDAAFGVIWLYWAILWTLLWIVLGLKREEWTRFTGVVAIVAGVFTGAVPAFMLLTGVWGDHLTASAIVLAVIFLASLALAPRMRDPRPAEATAPARELRESDPSPPARADVPAGRSGTSTDDRR